jgi:hypothetical protein
MLGSAFAGSAMRERDSKGEVPGDEETKRHLAFCNFQKWKKEREWRGFEIFEG